MKGTRKLAAIMFSDVVGYTHMMQQDEEAGRHKVDHYRSVLAEEVSKHEGSIIQHYGDGSLIVFESAVEAVRCAKEIQSKLRQDPVVPLRIGIHLGDIVMDGLDVYGDGVNVASRLESVGVSRSIIISAPVIRELSSHTDFTTESLGTFFFKNVQEPMEVFAIAGNGNLVPTRHEILANPKVLKEKGAGLTQLKSGKIWNRWTLVSAVVLIGLILLFARNYLKSENGKLVSIAVLPLDNISDDPEHEYFTAGMHDALTGALGGISALRVISRTSTLKYEPGSMSIGEMAEALGVHTLIEGSVFGYGDSVRIQLQLIEVFPEENHLWAREYHQAVGNTLKIQSEMVQDIAREIHVQLTPEEENRLADTRTVNPDTYKAYLRGMYFLNKSTPEDHFKGLDFLKQAIENDPADPLAYTGLAMGYVMLGHGPDPDYPMWQRGRAAALRAITLDSTLAEAHAALAVIKLYFEGDWTGAKEAFVRANQINPNLAQNRFHYAWYWALMGNMTRAFEEHQLAKELDPLTPVFTADLGSLHYWIGRYDEAIVEVEQALEIDPEFGHSWWVLGNIYAQQGLYDQAIEAHQKSIA
ncbi:MAG: adenylate/guanylate cyclase domain-containing protein, partial [Saprospiraceae bacterium]|nr:adenylate/guanylate cyclase domain-containing protein [Saprospiraceae bacterium]